METTKEIFEKNKVWCVVPVYNGGKMTEQVVRQIQPYIKNILIVDDGSTDFVLENWVHSAGVHYLRHSTNRGKGEALKSGLCEVAQRGGSFMISLDADGQHFPSDIPFFIPHLEESVMLIGYRDFSGNQVPICSRFGRCISNFFIWLLTNQKIYDTQSGFRVYPVKKILTLDLQCHSFDFEGEVIIRALQAGIKMKNIPISVKYPNRKERISHFHFFKDNWRFFKLYIMCLWCELWPK